jgi:5-aminopentanamidase
MIFLTRLKHKLPTQGAGIRFALYQGERPVGTPAALQDNLVKLDEIVREAKQYDVQLISFPELYLEGYTLTPALVQQLAEPVKIPAASCGAFRDPHQTNSVARFVGFSGTGYIDE